MKKYFIILILLALAIIISGCIGILTTPGEDSIAPGKGILEIYLTDSSEKYKANDSETYSEVNITISEIKVHLAGEDEGEWIKWTLDEEPYNLMELENVSVLLGKGELEPGKYTQIRLFVTEANIWIEIVSEESEEKIVSDSDVEKDIIVESSESYEEHNLYIPSNLHTGIKLIHPFEIVEGMITKLTIDFDAEKSVVKTDDGEYKLKPVIKVTSETYLVGDLFENPGSISGSVLDSGDDSPISEATVSVSLSDGEYIFTASIVTGQDGLFFIDQLPVGTYTLTALADGYDEYTSEDGIEVTNGETININIELFKTESLN